MIKKSFESAEEIFRQNKGILRTAQAKELGVVQPTLSRMLDAGILVKEARGLYRLADMPPLGKPDLVQTAMLVPNSIICLISALNFHDLTTQIPYRIFIALPRGTKKPRIDYPPLDIVHLSAKPYAAGIEEHVLDGISVRIYRREKTVADCFKFRNKLGKDIALEALQDYLRQPNRSIDKLLEYARVDRVENIIRPYIETLV